MAAQVKPVEDEWVDETPPIPIQEEEEWTDETPPIPIQTQAEVPPEESMGRKLWNTATNPLTDLPSRAAAAIAEPMMKYGESGTGFLNRGALYGGAMTQSVGDVVSAMTSPFDLAAGVLSGGASMAAKKGALAAAKGLNLGGRIASVVPAAHGIETMYNAEGLGGKALGALELAGGALGMRGQKFSFPEEVIPPRIPETSPGNKIRATVNGEELIPPANTLPVESVPPEILPQETIAQTTLPPPIDVARSKMSSNGYSPESLGMTSDQEILDFANTLPEPSPNMAAQIVDDTAPETLASPLPRTEPVPTEPVLPLESVAASVPSEVAPMLRKSSKLDDYSPTSEMTARGVLKEAGIDVEGMSNKNIVDAARAVNNDTTPIKVAPVVPLPKDLAGAKSRFNIGSKSYEPQFQSDLDKALYIIAQQNPSKRNPDYLKYVMEQTGLNADDAVKAGQVVRTQLKNILKESGEGVVDIPPIHQNMIPPPKPKIKVKFDKATNSLVPDTNDPATLAVIDAVRTKKPVPQNARISPSESVEIPEKPVPTGDKNKDASLLSQWLSVPRAMQSAYDISFPLRQGIGLVHTKGWWKAWPDMIRSYGDEAAYKSVMDSIELRDNFKRVPQMRNGRPIMGRDGLPATKPSFAEEMGLAMSDLTTLSKREEHIGSKIAEKVPGVRASNRAYTAFANKLRADTFDSLIRDAEAAGLNPRGDKVLGEAIANYVNNASGRGSLKMGPIDLESSAVALNNLMFSPRLMASRLQMMGQIFNPMTQPFVRKQYWKSMASVVGAWATFTGLNHVAGGTTGADPTSSEFGRTKVGNTRFDPSGGFLPYITLFARIGSGTANMFREENKGRYANKFPFNTGTEDAAEFISNKASPYPAQALKFYGSNKNRPYEFGDQALRMFTPIMLQDLSELLDEDPKMAPFGMAQAAVGIGSNTYKPGEVSPRMLKGFEDFTGVPLDPLKNNRDFTIPRNFRR